MELVDKSSRRIALLNSLNIVSFMNIEEIKKRIAKIEQSQQAAQQELDALKKIVFENQPKPPEEKGKLGAIYKELAQKKAEFAALRRLKNG